jgi:hypothetical protein
VHILGLLHVKPERIAKLCVIKRLAPQYATSHVCFDARYLDPHSGVRRLPGLRVLGSGNSFSQIN